MTGGGGGPIRRQFSALLDLLFPPACSICRTLLPPSCSSFCSRCRAAIEALPPAHCSCCALPFAAAANSSHLCADCSRELPPFSRVYAAGLYSGALRQALQQFKYSGAIDLDRPLADLLGERLVSLDEELTLVPVPLHPRRLRRRGYNQSLLLARALARNLQFPTESTLLERVADSHSQQGLDARQRALNMRGAFRSRRSLRGERYLLVDDVMTTGATVTACSRTLLDAGAAEVRVAVIARAPRSGG